MVVMFALFTYPELYSVYFTKSLHYTGKKLAVVKNWKMEITQKLSERSQQYYVITKQWLSDLEFLTFEAEFLHKLMENYFTSLSNEGYLDKLVLANQLLSKMEVEKNHVHAMVSHHIKKLEMIAENIIPDTTEELAENQLLIENFMSTIIRQYRQVKKDIYAIVETAMHENNVSTE
jgi:hypothetical protein